MYLVHVIKLDKILSLYMQLSFVHWSVLLYRTEAQALAEVPSGDQEDNRVMELVPLSPIHAATQTLNCKEKALGHAYKVRTVAAESGIGQHLPVVSMIIIMRYSERERERELLPGSQHL